MPQKSQKVFYKEIQLHHFLSQMTQLTTCKYSEHFYKRFRRKTLDKPTKRQTGKWTNERNVFQNTSLRGSNIGFFCKLQNILPLAILITIRKFLVLPHLNDSDISNL